MTKIDLWNILLNYSIDPPSFPLLRNNIIKLSRKYIISFVLKIKLTFACLLNYVAFDSNQISGFEDLKIPALF